MSASGLRRTCVSGFRWVVVVAVGWLSAGCESETSYACGACLKEPKCKYCTSMQAQDTESQSRNHAKLKLCESLVSVPGTTVDTKSVSTCMAAPSERFEVTCDKLTWHKWFWEGMPPL